MPDNTIITVFGRKGSGKTTLVKAIAAEHRRVLIIDTLGEYEPHVEGLRACVDKVLELREKRSFRIALRAVGDDAEGRAASLGLLEVIYKGHTHCLVIVEEVSMYCSPTTLPPEIAAMIRYGRHKELDQVYVARRPSEVHRDITAQSDIIATFHQQEPRDIAYLVAYMGKRGKIARGLPKYRVLAHGDMSKAPPAILAQRYNPPKASRQLKLVEPDERVEDSA